VADDSALGTAPASPTAGQLSFTTGTLQATASFTLDADRGIALTGTGTVSVDPGMTLSYGGVIAGASTLAKTGTGTLALSGTNTYAGATTVSVGVLRLQNSSALGTTAGGTSVTSGAAIEIDGTGLAIAEPITSLNGTGVSTTGALRNLASDNTWSGAITLAGTTRINSDGGTFSLTGGVNANTRALTVGGVGNSNISAITGTTATLTKDGAGTLTLAAGNTYTGRTTLNAGTVAISADTALGTAPVTPTASLLTFGGGTLATSATFTLDPDRGINVTSSGTFDVADSTILTYAGTETGTSGAVTKTGAGELDLSGATVTTGSLTISAGTLAAPIAGVLDINGDLTNNAALDAFIAGTGTVTLSGSVAQVVGGAFPITFSGLTINNPTGITIGNDTTVSSTLTLTSGNITTGTNVVSIAATGSVSRTSGQVVGNLRKYVGTGAPSLTFEIGGAGQYAPVTVAFSSVTAAGNLTASTTAGDHPALGSSSIDPTASANRYWTLSNAGIAFTDFTATFTFGAGDLDAGADTGDFGVGRYSAGTWQALTTLTQTSTSTTAAGITGLGDFAVGEVAAGALDHFVVSAPSTATAASAFAVTVTAVDALGNRIGSYTGTITSSSSDPHAAFAPSSYTFTSSDHGAKTFAAGATLNLAGSQTVTVTGDSRTGVSATITVNPGPFVKLQILVPGETADPGSATGKAGTPSPQTANSPFSVTVKAVDAQWNIVPSTDTIGITSSDMSAALPPAAPLVAGTATFTVTTQTGGPTTITATDLTDGTKTSDMSPAIAVTNTAPTATADTYEMVADNTLTVAAAGVLGNDSDAESQAVTVGAPRPLSGPVHGTLTLNQNGSFTYTPTAGYSGTDSFTYVATDGWTTSAAATVTIIVRDHSLISVAGWPTSFSTGRYLDFSFPAYVAAGSVVTGATFNISYRSLDAAGTTCYYVETYVEGALLAVHGSAGAPLSCNSGAGYVTDAVSLPEIDSATRADALTVRVYMRDSAGARSQISLATLAVNYYLP
jgi:autotransporter-associated beta strand protein